jgi:hypothetical protein
MMKSGKARLDSTRFTTWTGTNFNNNTTVLDDMQPGHMHGLKLDEAYRRTRTLINKIAHRSLNPNSPSNK